MSKFDRIPHRILVAVLYIYVCDISPKNVLRACNCSKYVHYSSVFRLVHYDIDDIMSVR